MTERLTLKNLGPITEFTVEPRPLTVLIGEQATGKSLAAQVLYFFRSFKQHLSELYRPDIAEADGWQEKVLEKMLDRLRGVPFSAFANGSATLRFNVSGINWGIEIREDAARCHPSPSLQEAMVACISEWETNKSALSHPGGSHQVFIPTERSVFTRLWNRAQSVLFAEHQPWPVRKFADHLGLAYSAYRTFYHIDSSGSLEWDGSISGMFRKFQNSALAGEAYVSKKGPQVWHWKVSGTRGRVLPIEAIASGQMEAWPFFVIGGTFAAENKSVDFYFEEPETHLHPRAQVEIMKAIVFLVNHGHRFVITTHSPFLLYVLNNMIQRFLTYGENAPEGTIALDPEKVVAYRMGAEPGTIMDREDTGLIDLNDLEKVADELGGEFDRLLEAAESGVAPE